MNKLILASIDREKLYKRDFSPNSRKELGKSNEDNDDKDFYGPLAKLLILIYETK